MKMGDRVVVLRSPWGYVGEHGEIVTVTTDGYLGVQLDDGPLLYFWPHDVELEALAA